MGLFLALTLAAAGAAASFAPSWDSFTLRTSAGVTHTLTAGNAFSSPGAVIAGDLAVMIALVATVAVAGLWRPTLMGAALLAGAIIPMAAQAVSALVQLGEHVDPSQFGISAAEASRVGLTISSGVTLAFWIYCAFVIALIAMCVRMLIPMRQPALVGVTDHNHHLHLGSLLKPSRQIRLATDRDSSSPSRRTLRPAAPWRPAAATRRLQWAMRPTQTSTGELTSCSPWPAMSRRPHALR